MNVPETIAHEKAIELLPWLVNGSMDEAACEAVHAHAQSCVVCKRELRALEQLQAFVSDAAADWEDIPEADMRGINARIDQWVERRNWKAHLTSWIRDNMSNRWRLAFAVQTAVLIGLATALFWPQSPGPQFTTLTLPDQLSKGHYVRVVFSPDMTLSQMAELLGEHTLTVATGPSARGVYTLEVSKALSAEERAQLLKNLQRQPSVQFAQWAVHSDD